MSAARIAATIRGGCCSNIGPTPGGARWLSCGKPVERLYMHGDDLCGYCARHAVGCGYEVPIAASTVAARLGIDILALVRTSHDVEPGQCLGCCGDGQRDHHEPGCRVRVALDVLGMLHQVVTTERAACECARRIGAAVTPAFAPG